MSVDRLVYLIKQKENPTVAGLDPVLDYIPSFILERCVKNYGKTLEAAGEAIFEFNKGLIDELYNIVPAVKPQSAYFELYGLPGIAALQKTINYAKEKGLYVILDVKRNDIGSTATAYSDAYLGETDVFGEKARAFDADALTVNGYLGTDGIFPFVNNCVKFNKAIFVLVKTSNPSSGDLQDLKTEGDVTNFEVMAELVEGLGREAIGESGYSSVGAVVGATYPIQAEILRKKLPKAYFLVPGYGAQGGGAMDVLPAFNKDGLGAIVNSSRAIMCAYKKAGCDEKDYAKAAAQEALRMKKELNEACKGL